MGERRGKGGRLAGKEGSGRGLMKRETGSKGRKCANEKMAGNEDIGGKRRERAVCLGEIKPFGVLNRCSTSARFLLDGERRGRGGK